MNEFVQKLSSDIISGVIPFNSISSHKNGKSDSFNINNIVISKFDIHSKLKDGYTISTYSNGFITKILIFLQDKNPEEYALCKELFSFIASRHFSENVEYHSANCGLFIEFTELFNKNLRSLCISDCINNKLNYVNRHTIESNFKLALEKTKLDMGWK